MPGGDAYEDSCGVCDDDASNDCVQDCAGVWGGNLVEDACGVCDGGETDPDNCGDDDCPEGYDACGVCGGIATQETGCFIELSIGSVADGVMEIILNNTIPVSGFQFELTGVELGDAACSGGSAGDEVFQVSNRASSFVNVVPVFGILSSWLWINEELGWIQLVSFGLIFFGVKMVNTQPPEILKSAK